MNPPAAAGMGGFGQQQPGGGFGASAAAPPQAGFGATAQAPTSGGGFQMGTSDHISKRRILRVKDKGRSRQA